MTEETATQQLASMLLRQPVGEWIAARRQDGYTWRLVAIKLATETDGRIRLSHETVRKWAEESAA